MIINIPDQALVSAKISSEDLMLSFAVYLYEKKYSQLVRLGKLLKWI